MKTLLAALSKSAALIGTFCTLSVETVELACHSGLDFIIIDAQHGAFDRLSLLHALRIADATDCLPIVRLPAYGMMLVEPLLDAGCMTLLAPMVNTAAEARALVSAACYPPRGQRSQSGCRAAMRGGADYRERFNDDLSLLLMIEHIAAVEQIDEILRVPGIAGCFVGPTDLGSSLAQQADAGRALQEAIERVRRATLGAGKVVGITAGHGEQAVQRRRDGFQLVTASVDRKLLWDGLIALSKPWRAEAGHASPR